MEKTREKATAWLHPGISTKAVIAGSLCSYAADRHCNIFCAVESQDETQILEFHADSNVPVSVLPMSWPSDLFLTFTVHPSSQELYVGTSTGKLLLYKAPWTEQSAGEELLSGMGKVTELHQCEGGVCWRDESHIRHMDLATRQVTVLHQGKGVQGYVVSGAPQSSPGLPPIFVNKRTHIIHVEQAAHGAVHRVVQIQWGPEWDGPGMSSPPHYFLYGSDGDGALIVKRRDAATGAGSTTQGRLYRVLLDTGRVELVAGLGPGQDAGSLPLAGDWWPGCKYPPMLLDLLSCPCAIDAKGHLLVTRQAFSGPHSCVLLTVLATCLKPPAHLDPCKGPGSVPCEMDSLRSDLGRLLMSAGDEADVALQCAGAESIRAHSQVLLARWHWFRTKQGSGLNGTLAELLRQGQGESWSPVVTLDVTEHSTTTMHMVLQYLYTGHFTLPSSHRRKPSGSQSSSSISSSTSSSYTTASGTEPPASRAASQQPQQLLESVTAVPASTGSELNTEQGADSTGLNTAEKEGVGDEVEEHMALLKAASYFLLPELHAACLTLAQQHLRPATALQWLLAAHRAGEGELEAKVLVYTSAHIHEVLQVSETPIEALAASVPSLAAAIIKQMARA